MTDARKYTCPKCGAEPGKRCRTLTTGRTTDDHEPRWNIGWNARQAAFLLRARQSLTTIEQESN